MQLLTLFALLGLLGSTLSKRSTLSARTQQDRCKQRAESAERNCWDGGPTLRFTYDPKTQKCDQFWESKCKEKSSNSFENFTECMTACNPTSKCLRTPIKHKGWIPWRTSFIFDIATMKCEEKKSLRKPSIGEEYNRFEKEKDCNNTCVPNLIEIVKSYN
uniref:Putative tick kunitz 1 n=1 Tax=Amblyomma cajennense TaxID=34607 RepID=A0A023FQ92_AMBCJ